MQDKRLHVTNFSGLCAGVLDEDLLSGLGAESVTGDLSADSVPPALQSILPSVITPTKEVKMNPFF
jgi:hypothetical protein